MMRSWRSLAGPAALLLATLPAAGPAWAQDEESEPLSLPDSPRIELDEPWMRAEPMSLAEVVERALAHNLGLQVRAAELERAELAVWGSHGAFHPTLTADVDVNWLDGSFVTPSFSDAGFTRVQFDNLSRDVGAGVGIANFFPTGTAVNLSYRFGFDISRQLADEALFGEKDDRGLSHNFTLGINQSLLKGFGLAYQLSTRRELELSVESAELAQERSAQDVAGSALKAFSSLCAAQEGVIIAARSVERALDQRQVLEARISAGRAAPIEIWRVEESVAAREQALLAARLSRQSAEIALHQELGIRVDEAAPVRCGESPVDPLPSRTLDGSRDEALRHNLDLAQLLTERRRRELVLDRRRHERLPELDLSAGLNLSAFSTEDRLEEPPQEFTGDNIGWSAGLSLSVPLGNRTALSSYRTAESSLRSIELEIEQAHQGTLVAVENAWSALLNLREQVRVAETRLSAAEQTLEAESARREAGLATLRDVLDSQQAVREAEQAVVNARIDRIKAQVDLEIVRGTLLTALGITRAR